MRILNRKIDIEKFYRSLAKEGPKLLFLDYDGTLAPFNIEPKLAYPYPGVPSLLKEIVSNDSVRLVIITGRSVAEITPLLGLEQQIEIWGTHGREHSLPDGSYHKTDMSPTQKKGLNEGIANILALQPQVRPEAKPGSVAFHWRGIKPGELLKFREEMISELNRIGEEHKLDVHSFNGGMELIVPGMNKGNAVREVLKTVTPDTPIAYLGDDLTDEDAFFELKYKGLSVLVRNSLRETQADVWIHPPHELITFLEKWTKA